MNSDEIKEYYIKYGPMVMRRCIFLLKNEDMAMDAMQEVFIKLLSKKESLTSEYPSALIYKISTNICMNILKKENKNRTDNNSELLLQVACSENLEDNIVVKSILEKIFLKEQPTTREIAIMHYIDGLTLEQTARESGLSVSGVRKRLRRLREKNLYLQDNKNV